MGWHSQCCVGISSLTPDCLGSGWIRPTLGRRLASPWMRWHAEKFSCGVNAGWFLHFYLRANPGPARVPPFLPPPLSFLGSAAKKMAPEPLVPQGTMRGIASYKRRVSPHPPLDRHHPGSAQPVPHCRQVRRGRKSALLNAAPKFALASCVVVGAASASKKSAMYPLSAPPTRCPCSGVQQPITVSGSIL